MLSLYESYIHTFKLGFPSAMDPSGIVLLKSIENVFQICGLSVDTMSFRISEIDSVEKLTKHFLTKNYICPTIIACRFLNPYSGAHAMVAIKKVSKVIDDKHEVFVQCKNSYRGDPSQPGEEFFSTNLKHHASSCFIMIRAASLITIALLNV